MAQDTGKFRKNTKDQYYTKSSVAKKCVDIIYSHIAQSTDTHQWIEPSAGNGVFLKILPANYDKLGIDLEPKSPEIQQGNFLDWAPTTDKKRIFFGNPPFGRQGSLAKSFIKHAAEYADIIAFILPRSFVKPSMSRAFPLKFHCLFSEELEKNAFEVNKQEYDVPCIFQIWIKKETDRMLEPAVEAEGFTYVKVDKPFDIAFKRVGGQAGKCYPFIPDAAAKYNYQYYYYFKLDDEYVPFTQKIIELVNSHIFPSNTVGMRSLSKTEANRVLNEVLSACSSVSEV